MSIILQKEDGRKAQSILGQIFGRLTVLREFSVQENPTRKRLKCDCDCVCGKKVTVNRDELLSCETKSCGCLQAEIMRQILTTHGQTKTRTYRIWKNMITRCTNKNNRGYRLYGERGIKVCARWRKFENFLEDMGPSPHGLSLDRKDNSRGYSKRNCHWATNLEQANNKRTNVFVRHPDGRKLTLSQWARILNMNVATLAARKRKGWSDRDILRGLVYKKHPKVIV